MSERAGLDVAQVGRKSAPLGGPEGPAMLQRGGREEAEGSITLQEGQ